MNELEEWLKVINDNVGIIIILLFFIGLIASLIWWAFKKFRAKVLPVIKNSKVNVSKPLVEGRTKGNVKKSTQTDRLAPPPPPVITIKKEDGT